MIIFELCFNILKSPVMSLFVFSTHLVMVVQRLQPPLVKGASGFLQLTRGGLHQCLHSALSRAQASRPERMFVR